MRSFLDQNWKPRKRKGKNKEAVINEPYDPLYLIKLEPKKMTEVVLTAINQYNNKAHAGIHRMTPHSMEDALFRQHNYKKQQEIQTGNIITVPKLTKNVISDEAQRIKQEQVEAIIKYASQVQILPAQEEQPTLYALIHRRFEYLLKAMQNHTKRQKDEVIEEITRKYQDLYEINLQLQQTLHTIEKETEKQRILRENSEEKRKRRKNAIKAPIRETIDEEEFKQILDLVKLKSFVWARKKCAMIIIYLTGVRVSNLLLFSIRHTKQLLEKGETTILLIKEGPQRFLLKISNKGRVFIKEH